MNPVRRWRIRKVNEGWLFETRSTMYGSPWKYVNTYSSFVEVCRVAGHYIDLYVDIFKYKYRTKS